MKPAARPPWHQRNLPSSWDKEEVLFFTNWMKGLACYHKALTGTAAERLKLLRRARNIYFKLAHQLAKQIRDGRTTQLSDGQRQG